MDRCRCNTCTSRCHLRRREIGIPDLRKSRGHEVLHAFDMFDVQYWLPDFGCGCTRKIDCERGATFGGRDHVDSAAVRFGDFAGDVKAHADAAWAVTLRMFGTGASDERVEYLGQLAGGNRIAPIMNVDEDICRFAAKRKRNGGICRTVLDGVT